MGVISREVAEAEINSWLDKKKIKSSQRETNKDSIETMIHYMMDGELVIDEATGQLIHSLVFPIGEGESIKKLTYKNRLNDKMLEPFMKGVNVRELSSIYAAYIAALTDTPKSILLQLESATDAKLAKAITSFFL